MFHLVIRWWPFRQWRFRCVRRRDHCVASSSVKWHPGGRIGHYLGDVPIWEWRRVWYTTKVQVGPLEVTLRSGQLPVSRFVRDRLSTGALQVV